MIPDWPPFITVYRCPACGRIWRGGSYRIDETRDRCTKTIHLAPYQARRYVWSGSTLV